MHLSALDNRHEERVRKNEATQINILLCVGLILDQDFLSYERDILARIWLSCQIERIRFEIWKDFEEMLQKIIEIGCYLSMIRAERDW